MPELDKKPAAYVRCHVHVAEEDTVAADSLQQIHAVGCVGALNTRVHE